MKYRKLRIAWTVVWGIAYLLMIAVWVSSYDGSRHWAYIRMFDHYVECSTCRGRLGLQILGQAPGVRAVKWDVGRRVIDFPIFPMTAEREFMMSLGEQMIGGNITLNRWRFVAPCWFAISLCVVPAALPWLPWRFSLRTLLIATTLIAVGLGLIVYVNRN